MDGGAVGDVKKVNLLAGVLMKFYLINHMLLDFFGSRFTYLIMNRSSLLHFDTFQPLDYLNRVRKLKVYKNI